MEKFAVDLDKVLDDFEYFEDHSCDLNAISSSNSASFNNFASHQGNNVAPQFYPNSSQPNYGDSTKISSSLTSHSSSSQNPYKINVINNLKETNTSTYSKFEKQENTDARNDINSIQYPSHFVKSEEGAVSNLHRQFEDFPSQSAHLINSTISQNCTLRSDETYEDVENTVSSSSNTEQFSTETLKYQLLKSNPTQMNNSSNNSDYSRILTKKNSVSNVFNSLHEYINSDIKIETPNECPTLPKVTNIPTESLIDIDFTKPETSPDSSQLKKEPDSIEPSSESTSHQIDLLTQLDEQIPDLPPIENTLQCDIKPEESLEEIKNLPENNIEIKNEVSSPEQVSVVIEDEPKAAPVVNFEMDVELSESEYENYLNELEELEKESEMKETDENKAPAEENLNGETEVVDNHSKPSVVINVETTGEVPDETHGIDNLDNNYIDTKHLVNSNETLDNEPVLDNENNGNEKIESSQTDDGETDYGTVDANSNGIQANESVEATSLEGVETKPKLCRPNSLDLVSKISLEENSSCIAPPGETPMHKTENSLPDESGDLTDFSPSTSEVSSVENHEGCVLDVAPSTTYDNHNTLGNRPPYWIPDTDTNFCMHCGFKFTVLKRRHHCRACGMVLCSKCCNLRAKLKYLGNIESRVCIQCFEFLNKDVNSNIQDNTSSDSAANSPTHTVRAGQPNPNNPMEYCSTVPPLQQIENQRPSSPPTVMVPVGVLKRQGSNKTRSEKTVMFSDGIRPGCDLTELDNGWARRSLRKTNKRVNTPPGPNSTKINRNLPTVDSKTMSYIPSDENSLPPTVNFLKPENTYTECGNSESVVEMLKNETLIFALQRNFNIHLKIINLECCVNKMAWCFATSGLCAIGQDEIIILLECTPNETQVPKDVFIHLNEIYMDATKGNAITEMGFSIDKTGNFLGSKNHAGFLYIRPTYQCLQNLILPSAPYLVGILIHRWETPWVKIFPLRLLLRLGAEYRYYPCPIISTRNRESVYVEIGKTIIKLLADFRNYTYTLPSVQGLVIHMEERKTTVSIPKNRYDQVMRALNNSIDNILAFSGNFSSLADSHLVCIQDTSGANENAYTTHAINIQNKPRKITGASFIILNGALKTSKGLTAKSSIIEDGLMIQIFPDQMIKLKDSLRNMQPFTISCGCLNSESDEFVNIVWTENDTNFNIGVKSPIDNRPMDGVPSIRVHNGTDHIGNSKLIRWTEVFIIESGEENSRAQDPIDISKLSESISKSTCVALIKYLDLLATNNFTKVAIRATLHSENVSYEAGSNGVKLAPIYMNSLDNELVPILHNISNDLGEAPIVLELIFHILNL